MILQNIWTKVVGNVLTNFPPANIFPTLLLPGRLHQNHQAAFDRYPYEYTAHKGGQLGLNQLCLRLS